MSNDLTKTYGLEQQFSAESKVPGDALAKPAYEKVINEVNAAYSARDPQWGFVTLPNQDSRLQFHAAQLFLACQHASHCIALITWRQAKITSARGKVNQHNLDGEFLISMLDGLSRYHEQLVACENRLFNLQQTSSDQRFAQEVKKGYHELVSAVESRRRYADSYIRQFDQSRTLLESVLRKVGGSVLGLFAVVEITKTISEWAAVMDHKTSYDYFARLAEAQAVIDQNMEPHARALKLKLAAEKILQEFHSFEMRWIYATLAVIVVIFCFSVWAWHRRLVQAEPTSNNHH